MACGNKIARHARKCLPPASGKNAIIQSAAQYAETNRWKNIFHFRKLPFHTHSIPLARDMRFSCAASIRATLRETSARMLNERIAA
jgi:hypothetical protein